MQGQHSNQSSFFGMIYEDLIPADHLLCKLAAAVNLSFVSGLSATAIVGAQPPAIPIYHLDTQSFGAAVAPRLKAPDIIAKSSNRT